MSRSSEGGSVPTIDDGSVVDKPNRPRLVQKRNRTYDITLVKEYARLLGLNKKGAAAQQLYVKGTEPVIIEEEAIIIRPHPEASTNGK